MTCTATSIKEQKEGSSCSLHFITRTPLRSYPNQAVSVPKPHPFQGIDLVETKCLHFLLNKVGKKEASEHTMKLVRQR